MEGPCAVVVDAFVDCCSQHNRFQLVDISNFVLDVGKEAPILDG